MAVVMVVTAIFVKVGFIVATAIDCGSRMREYRTGSSSSVCDMGRALHRGHRRDAMHRALCLSLAAVRISIAAMLIKRILPCSVLETIVFEIGVLLI